MNSTLHYLRMANHTRLQKLIQTRAREFGLTPGQPKVLDYLQEHDGVMQKAIALGCHIEASSLSSILNGMEKAGLITRNMQQDNRRTVWIRLTDYGRETCNRLNQEFLKAEQLALKNFSEEETGLLLGMLGRICENLSELDEKDGEQNSL